jgi:hypothetical protein
LTCAGHDFNESAAKASFILALASTRIIIFVGKWIAHCRNTVEFVGG